MSCGLANEINCMEFGETRMVRVSFANKLLTGELLTGTPTIAEVTAEAEPSGATGLTLANKAVTTAAHTINGETVAIGQGLEFTVAAGQAGASYVVRCTCGTDGSPAETLIGDVRIRMD